MHALVTLAHGIELPALSRKTGNPCRTVQTRQLVLSVEDDAVVLIGALGRSGRVHCPAVRAIRSVQRGLIVCAQELKSDDHRLRILNQRPGPVDWGTEGSQFELFCLGVDDRLDLEAAWPDTQGNIIAQMLQICSLLVPQGDMVTTPFRQVGHLWPNGQFARAANSAILSFVRGRGVVLAAHVPTVFSDQVAERFNQGWGGAWEPEPLSEKTFESAAQIMEQCGKPKAHVALTPALIEKVLREKKVRLSGWELVTPRIKVFHYIWRNGVSRDGTHVGENWPINRLFVSAFPSNHVHALVR